MSDLVGTALPVFFGVTVAVMGFAAFSLGRALAGGWKPIWHALAYCLLLGGADRFLIWGLFGGEGLSLSGYLVDTLVLIVISLVAYRLTRARRMVTQYPWLYERAGPFGWRDKGGS